MHFLFDFSMTIPVCVVLEFIFADYTFAVFIDINIYLYAIHIKANPKIGICISAPCSCQPVV